KKDSPRWVILLIDMAIVLFSYYFSNCVINSCKGRFGVELMAKKSVLIASVYYLSGLYFRTYSGIVRQTGFRGAWGIFEAVFVAWLLLMVVSTIIRTAYDRQAEISAFLRPSYAVLFTHAIFTTVCLVAARVSYRRVYESFFLGGRAIENVLIFGAGNM